MLNNGPKKQSSMITNHVLLILEQRL